MAEYTNFPPAVPLIGPDGKPRLPVTHADYVIDGVNRNNPKFIGSIFLNGISVFATSTDSSGNVVVNPLDPAKGGTGYNNLNDLAKKIAELLGFSSGSGSGTTIGIIPISKGGTGATSAAAALNALGAATAALYNVSIPVSWSDNPSGGYMQTVTVTGIKATDVPVVGVILSSDVSAAVLQGKAFANVNRITTAANSITLYCYTTKPTTAVSIQLLVVRGF